MLGCPAGFVIVTIVSKLLLLLLLFHLFRELTTCASIRVIIQLQSAMDIPVEFDDV